MVRKRCYCGISIREIETVPSKRDLLGLDTPFEGIHPANFQWRRILAFISGLGILSLYLWIDPFRDASDWVSAGFVPLPIGFLLYGLTEQSWRTAMIIAISVGVGNVLGIYFDSVGITLLP